MSLYKHTNGLKTNRLVEWFKDLEGNSLIKHHLDDLGAKPNEYHFSNNEGDANRMYQKLAAL